MCVGAHTHTHTQFSCKKMHKVVWQQNQKQVRLSFPQKGCCKVEIYLGTLALHLKSRHIRFLAEKIPVRFLSLNKFLKISHYLQKIETQLLSFFSYQLAFSLGLQYKAQLYTIKNRCNTLRRRKRRQSQVLKERIGCLHVLHSRKNKCVP